MKKTFLTLLAAVLFTALCPAQGRYALVHVSAANLRLSP